MISRQNKQSLPHLIIAIHVVLFRSNWNTLQTKGFVSLHFLYVTF